MRNLLYLFGLILSMVLLHQFLPWYAIVIAGLLFGAFAPLSSAGKAFAYGLLAGAIVWGCYSGFLNYQNESILATRIGNMFGGLSAWSMVIITALLGGIYSGLGSLVGFWGRQLFGQGHTDLKDFIQGIPKAELHLHIEGSFEPELMFEIANRNNITLDYDSIESLKNAYQFNNLQEFLDIYYTGAQVLIHEQDFFDLTWAYLTKVHSQNVVHVEVFFDPQTHTDRGVAFDVVINGIHKALEKAKAELNISYRLIMSYLRHLSEEEAFKTLESSLPFKDWIDGVGLDSSERGNPPSKFTKVFEASASHGYKLVAHAGEEGPSDYIWEALDLLKVVRIDHGNRCLDDEALVQRIVEQKIPLTLCPLSNVALKVIQKMEDHPVAKMLEKGILATIHSDDPAYFGGYMNENYYETAKALDLSKEQLMQLAINAFEASWLSTEEKGKRIAQVKDYFHSSKYSQKQGV